MENDPFQQLREETSASAAWDSVDVDKFMHEQRHEEGERENCKFCLSERGVMIPEGFYRTKVVVEIEVSHQFDPQQGIGLVTNLLNPLYVPAVRGVKVLKAESNFRLHQKPDTSFSPVKI